MDQLIPKTAHKTTLFNKKKTREDLQNCRSTLPMIESLLRTRSDKLLRASNPESVGIGTRHGGNPNSYLSKHTPNVNRDV